jgi:hypothetical protein
MNDETMLWRPRPPSAYMPTNKVLKVPILTLARTAMVLRAAGPVESACLWLGSLTEEGHGTVKALVVPMQINRPRKYAVPGEAMLQVAEVARTNAWTVVGAIHSHPGVGVEHSRYDDEMTPSRRAVSLVMPHYGHWTETWPHGVGVHEYLERYWHRLSNEHARQRVNLTDAPEVPTIDLR